MAEAVLVVVDLAVRPEEHVGVRGRGRDFAEVDHNRPVLLGQVQQDEPAPAHVARARKRHRERQPHRHPRVDGVAAPAQDVHPDLGGQEVLAGHHAVARHHRVVDGVVGVDGGLGRRLLGDGCPGEGDSRQRGGGREGSESQCREASCGRSFGHRLHRVVILSRVCPDLGRA